MQRVQKDSPCEVKICERWHRFSNFLSDILSRPDYQQWLNDSKLYYTSSDSVLSREYSPEKLILISVSDHAARICRDTTARRRKVKNRHISVDFIEGEHLETGRKVVCHSFVEFSKYVGRNPNTIIYHYLRGTDCNGWKFTVVRSDKSNGKFRSSDKKLSED